MKKENNKRRWNETVEKCFMWRRTADSASVMFYCVISLQLSAYLARLHSNFSIYRVILVHES